MSPEATRIVHDITQRCWVFGVAVLVSPTPQVQASETIWTAGWFDEGLTPPTVAVAVKDVSEEAWLGVLLHEYCHVTQWVEQTPAWIESSKHGDLIDRWLSGANISASAVRKAVHACREMEAECERRTVRLIRELQAPIDLPLYIQKANSYLHFHNVMLETRKWYRYGRGPYSVPEVTNLANAGAIDSDFSTTEADLWDAILTCLD